MRFQPASSSSAVTVCREQSLFVPMKPLGPRLSHLAT
jgi:hypothetical protein